MQDVATGAASKDQTPEYLPSEPVLTIIRTINDYQSNGKPDQTTILGISQKAGLSLDDVKNYLEELYSHDLVTKHMGRKNRIRYEITPVCKSTYCKTESPPEPKPQHETVVQKILVPAPKSEPPRPPEPQKKESAVVVRAESIPKPLQPKTEINPTPPVKEDPTEMYRRILEIAKNERDSGKFTTITPKNVMYQLRLRFPQAKEHLDNLTDLKYLGYDPKLTQTGTIDTYFLTDSGEKFLEKIERERTPKKEPELPKEKSFEVKPAIQPQIQKTKASVLREDYQDALQRYANTSASLSKLTDAVSEFLSAKDDVVIAARKYVSELEKRLEERVPQQTDGRKRVSEENHYRLLLKAAEADAGILLNDAEVKYAAFCTEAGISPKKDVPFSKLVKDASDNDYISRERVPNPGKRGYRTRIKITEQGKSFLATKQ